MEPRREEQQKTLKPSAGQKPKRFRIVKLEERIAPRKGGHSQGKLTACGTTCPTGDCSLIYCPTQTCDPLGCGW